MHFYFNDVIIRVGTVSLSESILNSFPGFVNGPYMTQIFSDTSKLDYSVVADCCLMTDGGKFVRFQTISMNERTKERRNGLDLLLLAVPKHIFPQLQIQKWPTTISEWCLVVVSADRTF